MPANSQLTVTFAANLGAAPVTVNLIMKTPRPQASTTAKIAAGLRDDEPNGQMTVSQGGGGQGFSWILPLTINHHAMSLEKTTNRQASSTGNRTRRLTDAWSAADSWRLGSAERGQRTFMLSLEGKW